jgi:MraZ protein
MPTRFREEIVSSAESHLIATLGPAHRCVRIYPLPVWDDVESKLSKLPSLNQAAQNLQMLMIGNATDFDMDAQGRLLIPPKLREYAGLTRDVMLIGQGSRFDLWDEAQWQAQCERCQQTDFNAAQLPELSSLSLL